MQAVQQVLQIGSMLILVRILPIGFPVLQTPAGKALHLAFGDTQEFIEQRGGFLQTTGMRAIQEELDARSFCKDPIDGKAGHRPKPRSAGRRHPPIPWDRRAGTR